MSNRYAAEAACYDGAEAPCYGIGLQHFAEAGAEGSASGGGNGERGNGLSGDFAADMQRYFGVSPRSDAGSAQAGAQNGEKEQEAGDPGSVTGEAADDQAAASGQQNATNDADAEFEELIKGKFKDQFGRRTQGIINERFRKSKETETKLNQEIAQYKRMSNVLLDKYGLAQDATPEQIEAAVKADNTMFSRQAMAKGQSVDAYRDAFFEDMQAREEEAAQQQAQEQQQAQQEAARREDAMRQTYEQWNKEAEELKKTFPTFDLAEELRGNEAFRRALVAGLPVSQAYYGANFDKISSGLVAAATQQAARRAAQTVAANRSRPAEGGQAAATGIKTGNIDVNSLNGRQIRDLIKRAEQGERISF